MTGPVLRAGAWPAVVGVTGVAVVVGGCGAAFPAAATTLFPICFALLAAAAAFTLDEPASLVVDVTPTGPARRTTIRAIALLAPLAAGALVLLAAAMRGLTLPWASAGLALAGNVLLGFAAACVARTRTGEPGATAGTAVVLVLMAPSLVPQVARWVRTFPAPGADGPSSNPVWWTVLALCVMAIAISAGGRRLPRWRASVAILRRPGAVRLCRTRPGIKGYMPGTSIRRGGKMTNHPNFDRAQATLDASRRGDYAPAFDNFADDIVMENGPGAGPWHHASGKDDLALMLLELAGSFGDTFHQDGRCVYADDRVSIS